MTRMNRLKERSEESLVSPDIVKFQYQTFLAANRTWAGARREFTRQYSKGKLSLLENIHQWSNEKFLWRGAAALRTHPLDAFLQCAGNRFSLAAREKLCRWKEARLGFFEVGPVGDETVRLRAWDVERSAETGEWFDAIDLSTDGVDSYRQECGSVLCTYLAPWSPEKGLFCSMGYSMLTSKENCPALALHLNLNHADFGQQRWRWIGSSLRQQRHRKSWTNRDWQPWLRERITAPFPALIATEKGLKVARAVRIFDQMSLRETRDFGNYMVIDWQGEEVLMGMTGVVPLDLTSAEAAALVEYSHYRRHAGPPRKAHLIKEMVCEK